MISKPDQTQQTVLRLTDRTFRQLCTETRSLCRDYSIVKTENDTCISKVCPRGFMYVIEIQKVKYM